MLSATPHQLTIERWQTTDLTIARFFAELPEDEREEAVQRALLIGVTALQRAQARVDLDLVRQEFSLFQQQIADVLEDWFRVDGGKLAQAMNLYLGSGGQFSRLFDPQYQDSAVAQLRVVFHEHFGGDGGRFVRLLDYTEPGSPLAKLQYIIEERFRQMEQRVAELRESVSVERVRREEREQASQKGVVFEDQLFAALERVARHHKDTVAQTGTVASEGRERKGDLVITLNPADTGGATAQIVVEAKRERGKSLHGKTGILEEMDAAMRVRSARFAIAVFSSDAYPSEIRQLRHYHGNRLVCSIDPDDGEMLVLELAYAVARAEVCHQLRHQSDTIDQARVGEAVRKATEKLTQFQGLKQGLTSLINSAENIRRQLDAVERDMRESLQVIRQEAAPTSEPVEGAAGSVKATS